MKLHYRLAKLERLQPPPSCAGCGYPATARLRILNTLNRDPLPTCKVCRRSLDHHGWPMHTPFVRVSVGERKFS